MTPEEEKKKYDYIRNIYSASNTTSGGGNMGIKTRQEKANEIRDLVTQINARVAELEEDGYEVRFWDKAYESCINHISDVKISRVSKL